MMWHLLQLELVVAFVVAQPVMLGREPTIVPLSTLDNRVLNAAREPAQNVLLVLKGVEADVSPGISWEVHLEHAGTAADDPGRSPVGVVSLFGAEGKRVEFVFAVDKAINAAGGKRLQIRFVPTSGVVVDGEPQTAKVHSIVKIGEVSLGIEAPKTP